MIRIGIVGAENSHAAAVAKTLNEAKKVPGFKVTAIWGETDEFAANTAQAGGIPVIVKKPADLIALADAILICHRHAKYHLPAAQAFLKARLPMFIDKPFCYRLAEGRRFLAEAARRKVPVTSHSALPHQQAFAGFRAHLAKAGAVLAAASFGPCDLDSVYGGIFFYGVHQVEMIVDAFGQDVSAVAVARKQGAKDAVASLFYHSGLTVSMHCLSGHAAGFQLAAITEKGPVAAKIDYDADTYLTGVREFCKMFRTGRQPHDTKRLLAPVAILEAMEKAARTGKVEKVAKL